MVKVCEICGDIGDALAIITCCECLSSCQHLFENDLSITDILWRKKLVMKCNLEEFRGSQFLWGVLRRPKHEDETKTPTLLLLDTNCEKCDDGPPGFKKICKCC